MANCSANPPVEGNFLYSEDILRFGDATTVGDPPGGVALAAAGAQFGPGAIPEQNAAGLAALAILATTYHPLETCAADLGVTLADDRGSGAAHLLPAIPTALRNLGVPVDAATVA